MIESAPSESILKSLNKQPTLNITRNLINKEDFTTTKKAVCSAATTTPSILKKESTTIQVEITQTPPSRLMSSTSSDTSSSSSSESNNNLKSLNRLHSTSTSASVVHNKPPAPPTTKYRIQCRSSHYNPKDIANSLYDIDEHLNKDLIFDYFFNDNYMLDCLTLNSNNYSCVNTFKESNNNTNVNNNLNNNNNSSNSSSNQPWVKFNLIFIKVH
jgi:hypothetical protein